MGVRRQSRESALQALFMCDFHNVWEMKEVEFCLQYFRVPSEVIVYALSLCQGVIAEMSELDRIISDASKNWSIARMGSVDRNVIRIATFELMYEREVPQNVIINEAIEIVKKFASQESGTFVNGILDKIAELIRVEQASEKIALTESIAANH